ncbi:MAG: DNA polymerase III subunit delta [Dehalococcoidia bacterium]|nr:DNA polymerase III subunit delta [Dehalococcoidia bacterium]
MIHIYYGADEFSIHEAVLAFKNSLGEASLSEANTSRLNGVKLRTEELQAAVQSMPFLGTQRLVIVEGLLSRFDTKEKKSGTKKTAKTVAASQSMYQIMAEIINNAPDSTQIVLVDKEIGKTNPLLKSLSANHEVKLFTPLKGAQLEAWTRHRVEKMGSRISEEAVRMLVRLVGSDLWTMNSEIEKLVMYATGRTIEGKDVQKLVSLSRETSVFTLVDAIVEGRHNLAQQSMTELLDNGAAPNYVLSMLARQLRLMVRSKELKRLGQPDSVVQTTLGLADYPFRKTIEQAARYSISRLSEFYHLLLEADLSIKTGRYTDELAITLLVADLCAKNN